MSNFDVWPEAHLKGEDYRRFRDRFNETRPTGLETIEQQDQRAQYIIANGNFPPAPPKKEIGEADYARIDQLITATNVASDPGYGRMVAERGIVLRELDNYKIQRNPRDSHLVHGVKQREYDTLRDCRASEIWDSMTAEQKAHVRGFVLRNEDALKKLACMDKKQPGWRECGEAGFADSIKLKGISLEDAFASPDATLESLGMWLAGKLAKKEINEIFPTSRFDKTSPDKMGDELVEIASETMKAASRKK